VLKEKELTFFAILLILNIVCGVTDEFSRRSYWLRSPSKLILKWKCGPMPNVMAALPNIGGVLCSTPQFG